MVEDHRFSRLMVVVPGVNLNRFTTCKNLYIVEAKLSFFFRFTLQPQPQQFAPPPPVKFVKFPFLKQVIQK